MKSLKMMKFPPMILLAAAVFAAGCKSPEPAPTTQQINVSTEEKIQITQEGAAAFEDECGGLYPGADLQKYVGEVGARLIVTIPENHPRNFPFTFQVLNADDVNAFATPGGFIYVTRGLLERLDNEDELAGVLAHQMAHVTMNHFDKQAVSWLTLNIGLTRPGSVEAVAAQWAGPLAMPDGTMLAANLRNFRFTPEDEAEADAIAMQYVARTGVYNPRAVLDAETLLDSMQSPPVPRLRWWRHTHPAPPDRKARMQDVLNAKYPEYAGNKFKPLDASVAAMTKAGTCFEAFDRADAERSLGERMLRFGFPKNAQERLGRATTLYDEAIRKAKEMDLEAAEFSSGRALANYGLFQSTGDEQCRKRAREDFDEAKRIDGNNFIARLYRGYFFLAVDKFYKKAEEELLEAARLDWGGMDGALAYLYLGRLYDEPAFEGKNAEKAARCYELYLAFAPFGADAAQAAERLKALKPHSPVLKLVK